MKPKSYRIIIFGAGRVGTAIHSMLAEAGHTPHIVDEGEWGPEVFDQYDVFICATPWQATRYIAQEVARRPGKLYFDMTEDVEIGREVRRSAKAIMVPHCGLAPGAVSIIAKSMDPQRSVSMGVGAIPVEPTGTLNYHLTWSTEGLVNEYIKDCPVIMNGIRMSVPGMGDVVNTAFGQYEAFNTSGGVGTFCDTHQHLKYVRYRTIRYPGHRQHLLFLLDELGFRERPQDLVKLFDKNLPRGGADKVVIEIMTDNAKLYQREIRGKDGLSAIQRTTAAGITAVVLWCLHKGSHLQGHVRPGNWIANEDIPREELQRFKCWKDCYE